MCLSLGFFFFSSVPPPSSVSAAEKPLLLIASNPNVQHPCIFISSPSLHPFLSLSPGGCGPLSLHPNLPYLPFDACPREGVGGVMPEGMRLQLLVSAAKRGEDGGGVGQYPRVQLLHVGRRCRRRQRLSWSLPPRRRCTATLGHRRVGCLKTKNDNISTSLWGSAALPLWRPLEWLITGGGQAAHSLSRGFKNFYDVNFQRREAVGWRRRRSGVQGGDGGWSSPQQRLRWTSGAHNPPERK